VQPQEVEDMSMMPWMVKAMPKVEVYIANDSRSWPALWHATTRINPGAGAPGRRTGDTVWLGVVDGAPVGIAFEWVEMRENVLALADPNAITSNLRFLSKDDTYVEPLTAVTTINCLAHSLPWQNAVSTMLAASEVAELVA
jgi:hypothetical protein